MLTIYHEPEGNISAGGSPSCPTQSFKGSSGSTADYVNMWHHIRDRFDALGVDNVVWVMNYMGYVTWHCVTKDMWPGNDYVDWVMWDPYVDNASWTTTVNSSTTTSPPRATPNTTSCPSPGVSASSATAAATRVRAMRCTTRYAATCRTACTRN